jgi:hypothetical protein
MKKAIVLFVIAITIFALYTLDRSFIVDYHYERVTDTSAVIIAKSNSISVRVSISLIASPNSVATITFPNGTQNQVVSWASYKFSVLLPKTASTFGNFQGVTPVGISLTEQNPIKAAFFSNITDSYFDVLTNNHTGSVDLYWFKVQGNAWVSVSSFGVGF